MGTKGVFERFSFILLVLVIALSLFFLTGATNEKQIGRYEMSVIVRDRYAHVYVIDTATGVVKYVDPKDEGKPFGEVKVR